MADDIVFIVANKRSADNRQGTKYFPDCVLNITENYENDITENPVETGESFSDHVQNKNKNFTVNGRYNAYALNKYTGDNISHDTDRLQNAYKFLTDLRDNKTIFTFVSKFNSFPDCVLRSLSVNITPENNGTLEFTLNITQIRRSTTSLTNIVQVSTVADSKKDDASSNVNRGSAPTSRTVLSKLFTYLFGDEPKDDALGKELGKVLEDGSS